jgi:hypothetical protein
MKILILQEDDNISWEHSTKLYHHANDVKKMYSIDDLIKKIDEIKSEVEVYIEKQNKKT